VNTETLKEGLHVRICCLGRKKKIKENPKWEQKDLDCCVRRNDVRKELKLFLS
jgi:hypothetical protein